MMNDYPIRKPMRLKGFDYSTSGMYFVTICTQNRECLFGEICDRKMSLNDAGKMVMKWWLKLNDKFDSIITDEYIIMLDHFHGIIAIDVGAGPCSRPFENDDETGAYADAPLRPYDR